MVEEQQVQDFLLLFQTEEVVCSPPLTCSTIVTAVTVGRVWAGIFRHRPLVSKPVGEHQDMTHQKKQKPMQLQENN
ncbi:hypothetical protein D3C84_435650 [compost metagenome]